MAEDVPGSWTELGMLLAEQGDVEAAEAVLRAGVEAGDDWAYGSPGELPREQGHADDA